VPYGFGQRSAIPSGAIGGVCTVASFRMGSSTRSRSLLVLDHDQRVLLRPKGRWETYGELSAICQRAGVSAPTCITPRQVTRPAGSPSRRSRRRKVVRQLPSFVRAPGYRKLRTKPRGTTLRVLALRGLFALTIGFGSYLGVTPAVLLPEAVGKVRILIGIIGLAGHVDRVDTSVPETVVFLPSDPLVAAAEQQLTGSVWHGAPTANLIVGGLFTLALPPVVFFLVLRVRRLRWKRARHGRRPGLT
jgi:hypothetical protein